jgi:hypothetical protein
MGQDDVLACGLVPGGALFAVNEQVGALGLTEDALVAEPSPTHRRP